MKIDIGSLIKLAPVVIGIVKNVEKAFGKGQGAEKKKAAQDAASDAVSVIEGVAKKDVLNDANVQALLSEAIEIGVQIMKLEDRLREIDDKVKAAKGTGSSLPN
jgi:hypothetical protein